MPANRMLGGIAAVIVSSVVLSGCALPESVGGPSRLNGPVTFIVADASGSTDAERRPGGLYETAAMKAVRETARHRGGEVFAAPIDGNSTADSTWVIDGRTFDEQLGGNANLGEAARIRAAGSLRPAVRRLLRRGPRAGSDILGALQRVSLAAKAIPRTRRRVLVLLSDGAIVTSGYDLYAHAPRNEGQRRAAIRDLRSRGELADLHGFSVALVGIGIGVSNRTTAKAALALWRELIPAMGGRLVSEDSSLRFPAMAP
jgi:hypothetical protein